MHASSRQPRLGPRLNSGQHPQVRLYRRRSIAALPSILNRWAHHSYASELARVRPVIRRPERNSSRRLFFLCPEKRCAELNRERRLQRVLQLAARKGQRFRSLSAAERKQPGSRGAYLHLVAAEIL